MVLLYSQGWLPYCLQPCAQLERSAPPAMRLVLLRLWCLGRGRGVSALEAELAALTLQQLEESSDPQSDATCAAWSPSAFTTNSSRLPSNQDNTAME